MDDDYKSSSALRNSLEYHSYDYSVMTNHIMNNSLGIFSTMVNMYHSVPYKEIILLGISTLVVSDVMDKIDTCITEEIVMPHDSIVYFKKCEKSLTFFRIVDSINNNSETWFNHYGNRNSMEIAGDILKVNKNLPFTSIHGTDLVVESNKKIKVNNQWASGILYFNGIKTLDIFK